jgi:hypothetical protein
VARRQKPAQSDLLLVAGVQDWLAAKLGRPVGRHTLYAIARELGQRVGPRGRLMIPKRRLEMWLEGEGCGCMRGPR